MLPHLDADEDANESAKDDEKCDYSSVVPRILGASPLQCQQDANDSRHEDRCSWEVEFRELFFESSAWFDCLGSFEAEECEYSSDKPEG